MITVLAACVIGILVMMGGHPVYGELIMFLIAGARLLVAR